MHALLEELGPDREDLICILICRSHPQPRLVWCSWRSCFEPWQGICGIPSQNQTPVTAIDGSH